MFLRTCFGQKLKRGVAHIFLLNASYYRIVNRPLKGESEEDDKSLPTKLYLIRSPSTRKGVELRMIPNFEPYGEKNFYNIEKFNQTVDVSVNAAATLLSLDGALRSYIQSEVYDLDEEIVSGKERGRVCHA